VHTKRFGRADSARDVGPDLRRLASGRILDRMFIIIITADKAMRGVQGARACAHLRARG